MGAGVPIIEEPVTKVHVFQVYILFFAKMFFEGI